MDSDEKKEKTSMRKGWVGVWRHVKPHKSMLVSLFILGLISAVSNGSVPYIAGRFFDALIGVSEGAYGAHAIPTWEILLAVWAVVQIIAGGTDWILDRLRRLLDNKVSFGASAAGFIHLTRLPLLYHSNAHISGEISKLSSASWRMSAIVRTIVDIAPQFLSVVIGIVLAMSINHTLAGVLVVGVVVYIFMLIPLLIPIAAADDVAHREWQDKWNDSVEAIHQVASVKQAAAEDYEAEKTNSAFLDTVLKLWMSLEHNWSNINFYQRLVVFLTQLSVFALSVQFVANGTLTVGELVALNGYSMMFFGPFVALGHSWQVVQNGLTSAAHLEEIFTLPEENYHPENAKIPNTRDGEVSFDAVGFEYEAGKVGVLAGMTFKTSPGEVVALVGESGAGKSTAIGLVSGYYFPTTGSVFVDGIDTREWDLTELRKRIAIVPQEVALFNDSIRTNIRYGSFESTDEEVEGAAKQAHIHDFIMTLPKGYETHVGERGVKLSVGQKQRVAIARAILRNPEILILDEPTSALDSATEKQITTSLEKLMEGRTTFIIAHRLSTVRKANKILVLKDGAIAEQGTHEELVAIQGGVYRNLYELNLGLPS